MASSVFMQTEDAVERFSEQFSATAHAPYS
jgi:hypothetical protein